MPTSASLPPNLYSCFPSTRYLLRESGYVEKLETIILKCNLFRICWGRRVVFISSYSSLIYSRVTREYLREKVLNPRNNHEKFFWIYKIATTKIFEPMKYLPEKILDPQNTHEKKFWTHKITTRKIIRPTKYPREKLSDSRRHNDTRSTRPMITGDPQSLAQSIKTIK